MTDGLGGGEIAKKLFLAPQTIKFHKTNIYMKLRAKNNTQAVVAAIKMGIVSIYTDEEANILRSKLVKIKEILED